MKCYNFTKRELYYIKCSGSFAKFLVQQFQSTLIKASVVEFKIVLSCRLQFCSYQNVTAARPFLQNFGDEIMPTKTACDGFLLWQQPTIFLRNKMLVDIANQVIVENIKFETHSYGLQSCKKDLASRHGLNTRLSFKSF